MATTTEQMTRDMQTRADQAGIALAKRENAYCHLEQSCATRLPVLMPRHGHGRGVSGVRSATSQPLPLPLRAQSWATTSKTSASLLRDSGMGAEIAQSTRIARPVVYRRWPSLRGLDSLMSTNAPLPDCEWVGRIDAASAGVTSERLDASSSGVLGPS